MTARITAWQCIGCGRIEGAQPCIGVCQDRKVDFVYAEDYAAVRRLIDDYRAVLRQFAWTNPRDGEWEKSFKALRERARRALAAHPVTAESE